MSQCIDTLEEVMVDLSVSEGRLGMAVESEPARVRLLRTDHELLSRVQPALALEVSGDGVHTSLWLDTDDTEALSRAVERALADPTGTDDAPDVDLFDPDGRGP